MPTDQLQTLRDLALNLKIEPVQGESSAASVRSIVKVLGEFNTAYENFLEIVLTKDEAYAGILEQQPEAKKRLLQDAELIAVDVNFSSFEVALAPQVADGSGLLFKDDLTQKKEDSFVDFKKLVSGDFADSRYRSEVGQRFNDKERRRIYQPLFRALKPSKYRVDIQHRDHTLLKTLQRPSTEKVSFYIPPPEAGKEASDGNKTYRLYVTMDAESALSGRLTKKSVEQVHYVEEVAPDTHPIIVTRFEYDELRVEFNRAIVGQIALNDGLLHVTNEELDLFVWGENREEAEEAFRFGLYSLYANFYYEEDEKLSTSAIELKRHLRDITKLSSWNAG